MSNFLKKALGLFVEFEPNEPLQTGSSPARDALAQKFPLSTPKQAAAGISDEELDKFEKHFTSLFESSNLPGPDYFEFWRMMETLEAHVPDEKARIAAVFATLSIQGLSREKLLETAALYQAMVEKDRNEFLKAAEDKASREVEGRKKEITDMEKQIADHSSEIQRLSAEITKAQTGMKALQAQVAEQEQKIAASRQGYDIACQAMITKIQTDIQKIQTSL